MVEVSFTFTPERLTDALKHYHRQRQQSLQLIWILVFLCVLIPLFGMNAVAWLIESLMVLSAIFLLIAPYIADWSARRSFRKSHFCDEEISQRFDETGLHEVSGKSDSNLAWSIFTKAVHFDDGFLLFSGPRNFRWIPTDAFANPNQIPEFEQLLRANINEHQVVEQVHEKGLKSVLLNFYRGITGDDFSRNEQSTIYRWSIRGFWLSFLAIMFLLPFANDNSYWVIAAMFAVCSLIICGFAFICSVAAREAKKWKEDRWRFSIRHLLIVVTVIALALGGLMIAIRN